MVRQREDSTQGDISAHDGVRIAWWRRLPSITPLLVDTMIAVLTAAAAAAALVLSDEPGARDPDALAHALLIVAALPLIVRRRWPAGVVGATSLVLLAYLNLGYPGGPSTVPLMVALYSVAAAGRRGWSLGATALWVGAGVVARVFAQQDPPVAVALDSALLVAASLLGDAVHSRRALRAEVLERQRRAEIEREREAQRRVVDERMRIARELHDVMAHTVTSLTVQAGAAADVLDDSPDEARAALRTVRASAREAMAELRATVSVLRSEHRQDPHPPAPGLDQLDDLLEAARRAGLHVELVIAGEPHPLPAATDLTAYRIVQEALTNVVHHAGATEATVSVRHQPAAVTIQIDDDGRGPDGEQPQGFGLLGMRERTDAVGGWLQTGAGPEGGFRVRARLPRTERAT